MEFVVRVEVYVLYRVENIFDKINGAEVIKIHTGTKKKKTYISFSTKPNYIKDDIKSSKPFFKATYLLRLIFGRNSSHFSQPNKSLGKTYKQKFKLLKAFTSNIP